MSAQAASSAAALLQQAGLYNAQQLQDVTGSAQAQSDHARLRDYYERQWQAAMDCVGLAGPAGPAVNVLNVQRPAPATVAAPTHCKDCGTALEDGRCFPCREQATIKRAHMSGEGWADQHGDIIAGMRAWQPVGR